MSTKRSREKQAAAIEFEPVEEEENEELTNAAKIKAPVVWSHYPRGYFIQDISDTKFDEIIEFILKQHLLTDLLCRNLDIARDLLSTQNYLDYCLSILKDKCSICAIHEETGDLTAVLFLRVINKDNFGKVFSRVKITDGRKYAKIRRIFDYLNRKSDIFTIFKCERYLRFYFLAVHEDHRKKNISLHLMRAGLDVAKSLDIDVVMGLFPTAKLQLRAKKVGMEMINEVYYVDWIDKDKEMVFGDPGAGNYTMSLMAGRIY